MLKRSRHVFLYLYNISLVPCLRAPSGEKWSDEQSRISWAYYSNVVMTDEIVRSVIIMEHFLYNNIICSSPFEHLYYFERVGRKMFLGYIVSKACASPRNLTWFTRLFLLVRGWGLGTRLVNIQG